MKKINPESWIPADNLVLEANALAVVKAADNHLVVAGPGAGKTELLAQKACYLLQTNTCKFPYKILAISFKRDAAYNLKERVKLRCGDELARRFDSFTFDSLAKQIIDRFRNALPTDYLIAHEYDIVLPNTPILDCYKAEDITYFSITDQRVIMNFHTAVQLPLPEITNEDKIRKKVWNYLLHMNTSDLSFKMLMRLAELVINSNPRIKRFLQQTYQFVFLDEFQDSTAIQYDLFKNCFLHGQSTFTAVGDDKQRIMVWAGAQKTIFTDFVSDTKARVIPLLMNFRSAPRLVILINHLTKNLLGKSDVAIPSPKWSAEQGECFVWKFKNTSNEMTILFAEVSKWINADNIKPSDICILVKQDLQLYAGKIIEYFNENGIKARNENDFQDLLSQEITMYIIHTLFLVFSRKAPESKSIAFSFLANVHTELEDSQMLKLENSFSAFVKRIKNTFDKESLATQEINDLIDQIVTYANKDRIRAVYPNYKSLKVLDGYIDKLKEKILGIYESRSDILATLDQLLGKDTIPVMTVHKSKGLEYHTVIFVGLEDAAFWSFQSQPDEDKCTFFVALSRAKERVVFTFSDLRENRFKKLSKQYFNQIEIFFSELEKSGVVLIEEK